MTHKPTVLVLFGGRSAEHEISLLSARAVVQAIDASRYFPILVAIDKQGQWRLQKPEQLLEIGVDPRTQKLGDGPQVILEPWPAPGGRGCIEVSGQGRVLVDVAFPVLHGPLGEDGTIQGLCELAGLPCVGASLLGSAVGMDKDVMKRLLLQAQLPVVPHRVLRKQSHDKDPEQAQAELAELGFPMFVKPSAMGSSVGVSRVTDAAGLREALDGAFAFDHKVVVESGLEHPREIECAVLGGDPPVVSTPGEIVVQHADGFYSYAAKYLDDGAFTRIPAELSAQETARVQQLTRRVFEVLECSGLARVDLFMDAGGNLFVNEINTLPGFTAISMYPKMMEASGIAVPELVSRLIDEALQRGRMRHALRTSR